MARRLLIEILHGLSIEGLLRNAVLETSYSAQLTARNAVLPLRWEKVDGSWPATGGWDIDASTGLVTGDADDAGLYDVTIQCTDGAGSFGVKNFRFRIAAAPLVFAGDLPDATVGDSAVYSYTISGGVGTKTVSLVSGALPAGASIDSAGNITGTYTAGASYAWLMKVVDGDLTEEFLSDSAVIGWPTLAKTGALTDASFGDPVGGSITLTGGDGTYTVDASPVSGTRPPGNGLALIGAVYSDSSGVTTTAGSYSWTDRFRSGDGQTLDVAISLSVTMTEAFDPAKSSGSITFSNSNKTATSSTTASWQPVAGLTGFDAATAAIYFEIKCDARGGGSQMHIGIAKSPVPTGDPRYASPGTCYFRFSLGGTYNGNSSSGGDYGNTFTSGDIIGICVKNGKFYVRKNGTWQGNPSAETGTPYTGLTGTYYAFLMCLGNATVSKGTGRFTKADLSYSIPSGCTALDGTS